MPNTVVIDRFAVEVRYRTKNDCKTTEFTLELPKGTEPSVAVNIAQLRFRRRARVARIDSVHARYIGTFAVRAA
jgi:hypothetical protein